MKKNFLFPLSPETFLQQNTILKKKLLLKKVIAILKEKRSIFKVATLTVSRFCCFR